MVSLGAGRQPVLVLSQVPPPVHGSTMVTLLLLDRLGGLGYSPSLVDRRFSRDSADVGRPSLRKLLAVPSLAGRLLRRLVHSPRGVRCIFFVTNRGGSLLVDWVLSELLRLFGARIINYVHTNGYRAAAARDPFRRLAVRRLLGAAEVTVCLGDALTEDIRPFTANPVRIVPNCVIPQAGSDSDGVSSEAATATVLFLSNLLPEKGAADFVRMAAALARTGANARFLLAGDTADPSERARLTTLARSQGAEGHLQFIGHLEGTAKWDALFEADLLVFPSTYAYEAQPLSIVEAMAAGTPVVAYDVGGVRDLVEHGVNGRLVPAGDLGALTAATRELLQDRPALQAAGSASHRAYEERHTVAVWERAWHDLLDPDGARQGQVAQEVA